MTPINRNDLFMKRIKFVVILLFVSGSGWAQVNFLNPHGEIRWKCESCHTPESFNKIRLPTQFQHAETGFLLEGKHQFTQCANCHRSLEFSQVATACADCHTDVHRGQFGFQCQNCHSPQRWENRQNIFSLHASRGFALVGSHAVVDCQSCHIDEQRNEFTLTTVECVSCHLQDYLQTSNPNHIEEGFDLDCQSCHVILSVMWEYLGFFDESSLRNNSAVSSIKCEPCH